MTDQTIEAVTPLTYSAGVTYRFSASRINAWMNCPLSAHFRYDENLPREQNAAASFGTAVHAGFEVYNTTASLDRALETFIDYWDFPEKYGIEPVWWPRNTSHMSYRKLGIELLKKFHEGLKWDGREVIGTEIPFCVPFGEFELMGFIDLLEVRRNGKGKELLRIVDLKTAGTQPTKAKLALDAQFCADEETEILTETGWKRHHELVVGERVLALDHHSGLAEWQPIEAVNVFDAKDQEMLSMEGKAHSSLTTLNHRWMVDHVVSSRKGWRVEKRVVTSEELTGCDRIPCAAPVVGLPVEPKWSDALVALVGWFWTEGHVIRGGSVGLAQREPLAEAIRSVLVETFGPSVESLRGTSSPAWRETRDVDVTRFYLNRAASEVVVAHVDLPSKAVRSEFITSLTRAQLTLLADVSVQADGHVQNGRTVICQSDRARLDSLQMVYALLGHRTSLRRRRVGGQGRYSGREFWELAVKDRRPNFIPKKDRRERVRYTGKVWCPTTANGTWYARRNGQVYFTGNTTYTYATTCPEFWVGNGELDFPGLPNGQALFDRFVDTPRRAIWFHIRTQKEIDAGARVDEDFMRLYRVCHEISKAIKADIHVPKIGDACGLCDFSSQCTMEIPVELGTDPTNDPDAWI